MDQNVDVQFTHRLSLLEDNLLDPITDRSSLTTFNVQWMKLVDDLNGAIEAGVLSSSTIFTAYALAQRVSRVVQSFLDLDILSEKLISSLALETSCIMDAPASPITPQTPDQGPTQVTSMPSYIQPAYEWLLKNIHHPYPSIQTRDKIATTSGSARKDVDGWFVDARKRIGWNALRKTRFSNKRIEIVDAATRFFVHDDPKRPLDPNIELEFAAIETRTKDLYSEKFSESNLAAKLDVVVKDMTPETKKLAKEEARRRLLLEESSMRISRAISSYPSPDRSPNISPVPDLSSLVADHDDPAATPDESNSSRKRQYSSSDADESFDRPNKRFRLEAPQPLFSGLPSPASSFHEDLDVAPSTVASTSSNAQATPALNRKRRLSDADVHGAPKRPWNLPVGPRLHAVSDPLPMSSALLGASAFDGWYNEFFEFPSIASVDELDSTIPVEVELCDTAIFDVNALELSPSICHPKALDTPSIVSSSPSLQTTSLSLDANPNEFDFTDLFGPEDFTYPFQGQNEHGSCLPIDIPPLDLGFSFDAFHPYTTSPMPLAPKNVGLSGLPDFLSYSSTQPSPDADWSSFSQLLCSPPPLQKAAVGSHDNLPDVFDGFSPENFSFDPMMVNSAQPTNDVVDVTLADRAAKEKRLLEMKVAARQLEEELAASR